ncbi:MAG TPA: ABC transporter permease [Nitrospirales bacterium]|nr:glutathione ABC transporter permease GsiC [Nitrospiraceae bacterium]HNP29345.1 ABC transporter permease [Nitrospirales bacterium]
MTHFLVTRILSAMLALLGVICLVFLLIHIIPGDPVEVMLGESAQPMDKETLRHALGLDLPLHQQWWIYFNGLLHLDLGTSLFSGRAILDLLIERIPATIYLSLVSLLVAIGVALPLGLVAAVRQHTPFDYGAMGFALFGMSIPNFWMGPLLILVGAIWLGWFPVSGQEGWNSVVLPALTLGTAMAAILARMIRSSVLEVLGEDFMRTARAKGLSSTRAVLYHALPNALLPILTLLGLQLGGLLGGAVITETVFAWPGIGLLMIEAIQQRDYPVVQAAVLCISVTYIMVNLLTDLLYAWLDPRIQFTTD